MSKKLIVVLFTILFIGILAYAIVWPILRVSLFYAPIYSCEHPIELGTYEGSPSEEEAKRILDDFLITNHNFTQNQVEQLHISGKKIRYKQEFGLWADVILYADLGRLRGINLLFGEHYSLPSNIEGLNGNDEAIILEKNKIKVLRNAPC